MWNALVDKNSLKYSNEEIERISSVSTQLHEENERLRFEIDSLTKGRLSLLEKLQEYEKIKQNLQKELNKTSQNLKFEIKAREGLAKRSQINEYEAIKYKEECFTQREEIGLLRYRNKDLEYRLNQERSKRLCELHEMDLIKKRNNELESLGSHAEKEALEARQNLAEKLEKLEGVMAQNESQKRIIGSMTSEILVLNSEMASLKEDLKRALEGKYQHEHTISTKVREMEGLEREVSRLRREVALGMKGTWNLSANSAFNDLLDDERSGSSHGNTAYPNYSQSTVLPPMSNSMKKSNVISMAATPFSTSHVSFNSSDSPLQSPQSSHVFHPSELQGKRYNRGPFAPSHASPPTSPSSRHRITSSDLLTEKKSPGSNSEALSAGPKSRYTGTGLGLKKSEVPDFNPKGSAKSVLKRILKEQQEKEKR